MNRRKFISASGAGAAAAAATVLGSHTLGSSLVESEAQAAQAPRPGRRQILMKVGAAGSNPYDAAALTALLRFGVKDITARPQIADEKRLYATAEEFARMRALPDKMGLTIGLLTPPHLSSSHIDREANPYIMLGKSPERDREIEGFQQMIKNAAAAGIPAIKYNMSILGVLRTNREFKGRADTSHSHFDLAEARKANPPLTKAGVVNADAYWERITYFLDRVVPVATEYKVKLACHPHDSMTPPEGYQGIDAVLSRPEGLKRFVTIKDSPFHGLNLCLGTLSEMFMNPAEEIFEPLTWLASRKKIHNIHFRNIKGNRIKFSEVAPDEGDVDFTRAIAVLAEHGYDGMIQPDHAVRAEGDSSGGQAYTAFVYGYIQACIKAAGRA